MFFTNHTWQQFQELRMLLGLSVAVALFVGGVLKVTWPYGHWVALVAGAIMWHLTQRALAPLGKGDGGPGGGFVDERRRALKSRRVLFAIVGGVGAIGAIIELVSKLV
jgi:hypothetical protein